MRLSSHLIALDKHSARRKKEEGKQAKEIIGRKLQTCRNGRTLPGADASFERR